MHVFRSDLSCYVTILTILLLSSVNVSGLKISCGTRGASLDFVFPDTDLRELKCVCSDSQGN